jgi:hypothetical protein
VNVLVVVVIALLVVLPGAPLPAVAAALRGQVLYTGPPPPPRKVPVTVDQYVCGKEKDAEDLVLSGRRGIRSAVVWLADPPSAAAQPVQASATPQMDQKQCSFTPRVVLVPGGRTIPVAFARPEFIPISCDLHSWMRGWVVVTDHPFYAVTDADGGFALGDVPPGRYTVNVWHETLGTVSRSIDVTGDVTLTLELPR